MVTNIVVYQIVASVDQKYIKDLNKDYFGYSNITIKELLDHLQET